MARKDFTKKQIKDYVANPTECPNCGSKVATETDWYAEGKDINTVTRVVSCDSCPVKFEETFELKTIKKISDG